MHEESIFHKALEIESADERESYLDQTCAGDTELRQRVDALLKAHDDPGTYLKKPDLDHEAATLLPSPISERPVTERPGSSIGPYKLLQQIGEGGMGVVYMAEQQEPVRRKVALKIIKPGMDTDLVIARFEAERQALAMMEHQNIARVLDAGATATGRPYFVMELVRGTPITSYCDKNRLTPRKRLELFVDVCRVIQHAHQKGVIHRDIKPSNVLVCSYDGEPVPKVIDFGVAKATQQRLTEKTLFTLHGQVVGTLEYMSPEQAEMSQIDIDTRSDIYSLGVLLYELLTGSTPISKEKLREAAFVEILRSICEDEPAKPSTRLSESADALSTISAQRRTDPKKLGALIRGDLDWIVMKSMDKDRTRRYDSATAFAADVERYLQDEPVAACPPSAAYKFRKLLRRNRLSISVAAMFVFLLFAATVVSTGLAIVASNAKAEAVLRAHMLMNAEKETRKAKDLEADARQKAEFDRDRALLAEERAQDTVVRSLFEQSRAVRLAGRNGHRWQALELLRRAEVLRSRERTVALAQASDPVTEPDGKSPDTPRDQKLKQTRSITRDEQLPQLFELRNEAVAALLSLDARIAQQWNSMNQAISPNGRFAVLTSINPNARPAQSEVRLIDLRSGEELRRWNNQEIVLSAALALSSDGKQLAAGKKDVALYDTATGDKIRTLQWPTTNDSAFNAGKSTDDNQVLANWEGVRIFKLAFSDDGHRLAAASFNRNADKSIVHWNLRDSDRSSFIKAGEGHWPILDVCFSADSQLMALPLSREPRLREVMV